MGPLRKPGLPGQGNWEQDPEGAQHLSAESTLAELPQARKTLYPEAGGGDVQGHTQQWGPWQAEVQALESIYGQLLGAFGQG